jgi:alkanesulfonate monooxygenase SsuD/methylene tetrahydromethanopterin reductase-like flavin-dependent oxidoreductase (luciferase family)
MQVGVSLRSAYATQDPREGARWMIERARAASSAGLDSLFVGDHHSTGPFPYYQNVAIMGRLLAEWRGHTAGVLMLLPLWNPVLAAEQLGTLAAIHDGPFVLQCAVGGGGAQFGAMGVDIKRRPSLFEASLDVVRRLLAGDTVSMTAPFHIERATIAPICADLEVWIGGAASVAIDRAARLGDAFLVGPEATPDQARDLIDVYRDRCAAHGRTPKRIAIRRDVHVAADAAELATVVQPIIERGYRGFDPGALAVGETGAVTEAFATLRAMGYTDIIVRHLAEDHAAVLGSFERLGAIRAALGDL